MRILALVLASAALTTGCASTRGPTSEGHLYRVNGFMVWSCDQPRPKVFLDADAHASPDHLRAIIAHETSHVLVAEGFGSCEAYHRWRKDPQNRLLMEAIAYCAMIRQEIRDGRDGRESLRAAGRALTSYGFGITQEQAMARIASVCA